MRAHKISYQNDPPVGMIPLFSPSPFFEEDHVIILGSYSSIYVGVLQCVCVGGVCEVFLWWVLLLVVGVCVGGLGVGRVWHGKLQRPFQENRIF